MEEFSIHLVNESCATVPRMAPVPIAEPFSQIVLVVHVAKHFSAFLHTDKRINTFGTGNRNGCHQYIPASQHEIMTSSSRSG